MCWLIKYVTDYHTGQMWSPSPASTDNDRIDEILNDFNSVLDVNHVATNRSEGNFYVFPVLPDFSRIANFRVVIRPSDLELKSFIEVKKETKTLDKQQWEAFWQVFNLVH